MITTGQPEILRKRDRDTPKGDFPGRFAGATLFETSIRTRHSPGARVSCSGLFCFCWRSHKKERDPSVEIAPSVKSTMQINAASLAFPGTLWQALKGKHVRRWPGLSGPGFFLPLVSTRPAEEQCHVNTPLRFPDDPREAGYIGNFRPSLKAGNFER